MRLFWERGYHATSVRDLTDAMGINAYSLYAEFETKERLFEAALDHYDRTVVTGHFGTLEAAGASVDTVREVVWFFGESARRPGSHLGCLLCNAGTEQAPNREASYVITGRYTARLSAALAHALTEAKATGALLDGAPVPALAHHLTVVLMGLFVLMRSQAEDRVLRDAAEQALAYLDRFTADGSKA